MLRIPNGEDVNYDNMKQPYKDEEEFIEQLQNAIWPKTDPESFAALLDEGGKECLEMRYGQRQETCLHRYFIQNKNTGTRMMIFNVMSGRKYILRFFITLLCHRAARFGKCTAVSILLERGASVNVRNNFGSTPLHLACEYGHHEIVKVSCWSH